MQITAFCSHGMERGRLISNRVNAKSFWCVKPNELWQPPVLLPDHCDFAGLLPTPITALFWLGIPGQCDLAFLKGHLSISSDMTGYMKKPLSEVAKDSGSCISGCFSKCILAPQSCLYTTAGMSVQIWMKNRLKHPGSLLQRDKGRSSSSPLTRLLAVQKQLRRHLWGLKSQKYLLLWLGLLGVRSWNKKEHASSREEKGRWGGGGGRGDINPWQI